MTEQEVIALTLVFGAVGFLGWKWVGPRPPAGGTPTAITSRRLKRALQKAERSRDRRPDL